MTQERHTDIDGASVQRNTVEVFGVKPKCFWISKSYNSTLERVICNVELHIAVLGVVVGSLH